MAGIDKIYLTNYNEYKHLEQFCDKYNPEFFEKHKYYLSCGLYDDITPDIFKDGEEHPVSNFNMEADIFIIQHLSDTDFREMPNVIARLKDQYSYGNHKFDLIRQYKSEYDKYQIDYSGCKVKLVEHSCNKTLSHIKREKWDQVWIDVCSKNVKTNKNNFCKYYLSFDYYSNIIFNRILGCKYYKHLDDGNGFCVQFLHNITMKQVYKYITRVRLKHNTEITVYCRNYLRDKDGLIIGFKDKAEYLFRVV